MRATTPYTCLRHVVHCCLLMIAFLSALPFLLQHSQLFVSPRFVLQVLHLRVALSNALPIFLLSSTSAQRLTPSEIKLLLSTPLAHTTDQLLMLHQHPFLLIVFRLTQPIGPFPSYVTISGQKLTDHPTAVAYVLPVALIFRVICVTTLILCCFFISTSSVWLSCMPFFSLQIVFPVPREDSRPAVFTTLSMMMFFDSLNHPPLQRLTSSFVCSSLGGLFPVLLPQFYLPMFSTRC